MDPLGFPEKLAGQAVHVDMPRIGLATGQAGDLVTVELKGPTGRYRRTASKMLPGADQRRQEGNGAASIPSPFVPRHPIADFDKARSARRILSDHGSKRLERYITKSSGSFKRPGLAGFSVLLDPRCKGIQVTAVLPALGQDLATDGQGQCSVGPDSDLPVLVGEPGGFVSIRIDMEDFCTAFARLFEDRR